MALPPTVRTRLALGILAGFVVMTVVAAGTFSWYGYRVFTELRPGSWNSPTEILDRNGRTLVALYGSEWRVAEPVVLADLPDHVPNAFLAAEDSRFRSHIGIDPIGVGRAAVTNVRAGGVAEGGSTITQQLAKTRFLSNERTLTRKFVEAGLALLIELRLSKDEILEAYLNEVYLGHRDGREVRGIGEAARVYFGRTPKNLTVAQSALLAGMIRAPNRDNPDERLKIAKQRRDAVLAVMFEKKWIDVAKQEAALKASAEFSPGSRRLRPHPYLIAALRQEFIDVVGARQLHSGGLKIHTAVDRPMQLAAEAAVRSGTQQLRARYPSLRRKKPLQAAILSVEPQTGGIRALVGGSNFRTSQFDRTRRMERQPGSAFKPFTYAAAIASGRITPASIVDDQPIEIRLASNNVWKPKNYDQRFRGPVTVRDAFEKSLNVPAIRVASNVGVGAVQDLLHEAGIPGDLSETPAIALGVDDVSMRELIAAYSIFPNLGVRTDPHVIEQVVNRDGEAIYRYEVRSQPVLDPAVAYVVHSLMRGVVQRGTAASLNASGLGHIAGKTGTTNNYRDAWFVGYSPDLLTAAWVGFDDGTPLRMSSAEAALPVWSRFMSRVTHARDEIRPPDGVSLVEVEVGTGRRWAMGCGPQILEVFIAGTEPRDQCTGMYDPSIYAGYVEPPMLTEEEWAAWAAEMGALRESEIVNDPDDMDLTTEPDSLDFAEPDSIVRAEPFADSVRREEERKRREGQRPPVAPPISPPVAPPVSPPVAPPPPPPPTDSVTPVDSATGVQR